MICVALLGMVLASCHQDEDDLFTTAAITLTAEEGTTVERVQGTVQLTNLNTRQVTTTAEFDGNIPVFLCFVVSIRYWSKVPCNIRMPMAPRALGGFVPRPIT